jgi:hypothetical protein
MIIVNRDNEYLDQPMLWGAYMGFSEAQDPCEKLAMAVYGLPTLPRKMTRKPDYPP